MVNAPRGGWLLACLLAAITVMGCQTDEGDAHTAGIATAEGVVSQWLLAMTAEEDHGFALLHPDLQTAKMRDLYRTAFVDGGTSELSGRVLPQTNPQTSEVAEFYVVTIELAGGSGAMPQELVDAQLTQPYLLDSVDAGIVVVVRIDARGAGIWTPKESAYRD